MSISGTSPAGEKISNSRMDLDGSFLSSSQPVMESPLAECYPDSDCLREDKQIASKAVLFVINSARKGAVPLCSSIAELLRENRRLQKTVEAQKRLIKLLRNTPPAFRDCISTKSQTCPHSSSTSTKSQTCPHSSSTSTNSQTCPHSSSTFTNSQTCPHSSSTSTKSQTRPCCSSSSTSSSPSTLLSTTEEQWSRSSSSGRQSSSLQGESRSPHYSALPPLVALKESTDTLTKHRPQGNGSDIQTHTKDHVAKFPAVQASNAEHCPRPRNVQRKNSGTLQHQAFKYGGGIQTLSCKGREVAENDVKHQQKGNNKTRHLPSEQREQNMSSVPGHSSESSCSLGQLDVSSTDRKQRLKLDDRVLIERKLKGVVRFIGYLATTNTKEIFVGVELDTPCGESDGEIYGKRYFTCKPNHGTFTPISDIQKLSKPAALPDSGNTASNMPDSSDSDWSRSTSRKSCRRSLRRTRNQLHVNTLVHCEPLVTVASDKRTEAHSSPAVHRNFNRVTPLPSLAPGYTTERSRPVDMKGFQKVF
ncbi:mediator of RNA polymerase II transcription subunit 1-like isoform X2 [Polyodon spathula]|uniref:mediator of RNA polymerase II transcription subunit 1-like isoform X2 n=1 Tax=Polyodon spathula TaxID=7913 RepID=UPI001B7DEEA0|nr:mediator of RNA polymerase II transcription subunit 1-like isoform X2 [Polyodon spathula]